MNQLGAPLLDSSPASDRPLKILQVCAIDLTAWLVLRNQLQAMVANGWDVSVACSDGGILKRLERQGITTHAVGISRNINVFSHMRAVWDLFWLIKKNRYDIVNVHTPIASLIGRLAAKLAGVPLVVYTAHGFYFHEHMELRQRQRHVTLERAFRIFTDHLFTVSSEDATTAVQESIMAKDGVTVIGNGVDLERFKNVADADVAAWRKKLGIPDGNLVIGIVGRLVEEKGFLEFFEAAKKLTLDNDNVAFVVVGSALEGDRDRFDSKIGALLKDPVLESRVFFTGFTEDVPELMSMMDIFTLPSHREGLPLSILEAMAAGKAVVATDIRGCREEVVDGLTGFLVPLKDSEALADRLSLLLQDADLRQRMGEAGRRRVECEFDEKLIISRILNRLEYLFHEKERRSNAGVRHRLDPSFIPTEAVSVIPRSSATSPVNPTSGDTLFRA